MKFMVNTTQRTRGWGEWGTRLALGLRVFISRLGGKTKRYRYV